MCPPPSAGVTAPREVDKLKKKGLVVEPVSVEGRTIARTLLGQGVVRPPGELQRLREPAAARADLRAKRLGPAPAASRAGRIDALVQGSELYEVTIEIAARRRRAGRRSAAALGTVDSLVELLQGKLSTA